MSLVGIITPVRDQKGNKFLLGDTEGAKVLSFWLRLYAPNREEIIKINNFLQQGESGVEKIKKIKPKTANYYCNFELYNDIIFISDDDLDGFTERMIAISLQQLLYVLSEYLSCVEVGLKNSDPFVFEYKADSADAIKLLNNASLNFPRIS